MACSFETSGSASPRCREVAAFINEKYEGALRRIQASSGSAGYIAKAAMDFSTFTGEGPLEVENVDSLKLRIVALGSVVMRYRIEHNSRCDSVTTSSAIVPSKDGECPCPICMDVINHYRFQKEQSQVACPHETWAWKGGEPGRSMRRFCKECDADLGDDDDEMVKQHFPYRVCAASDCRQCEIQRD